MTEISQINSIVRRHLAPLGRFIRMESSIIVGLPDWYYVLRGQSGWIEAKLVPPSKRCPSHFTLDQILWGEAEVAAGGRWHLLGLEPRTRAWMLFDVGQARAWFDGENHDLVAEATGPFPTREIALALAPRRHTLVRGSMK